MLRHPRLREMGTADQHQRLEALLVAQLTEPPTSTPTASLEDEVWLAQWTASLLTETSGPAGDASEQASSCSQREDAPHAERLVDTQEIALAPSDAAIRECLDDYHVESAVRYRSGKIGRCSRPCRCPLLVHTTDLCIFEWPGWDWFLRIDLWERLTWDKSGSLFKRSNLLGLAVNLQITEEDVETLDDRSAPPELWSRQGTTPADGARDLSRAKIILPLRVSAEVANSLFAFHGRGEIDDKKLLQFPNGCEIISVRKGNRRRRLFFNGRQRPARLAGHVHLGASGGSLSGNMGLEDAITHDQDCGLHSWDADDHGEALHRSGRSCTSSTEDHGPRSSDPTEDTGPPMFRYRRIA